MRWLLNHCSDLVVCVLPVSEREVIADITQSFKHYELSRSWILYNGIFNLNITDLTVV